MGRLKRVLIILITIINLQVNYSNGFLLDLFSEKDRHGLSIRLEISDDECSNLPVSWTNRAGSINSLGSCVQLYDEPFCKGSLTVIQPFHTIHQMDMSLINFANRIQSGSPCGPKIKTGRYVIQSAADATVLTVNSKYGGFARAHTTNATKVIPKFQQWEILDRGNSEFTLKPREFGDNYPVSYDEEALKNGQIKRKIWKLMSVGRSRYLIKNEPTQRCLYKTESNKVEEHDCRIWSPNQEWVFREIFGNPKPEKQSAAVGPGLNFNILSKVAGYRPPTKAPPQFYPIFYNITTLSKIKRLSTALRKLFVGILLTMSFVEATPYIIRKKIKRGPRPQTKPYELINALRPPGLRPAISSKIANNNNYLLLRDPPKAPQNEFVPTDDKLETYSYYQFVQQQAQKQAYLAHQQQLIAQQQSLVQQTGLQENPNSPKKQNKKKEKEQKDEESEEESAEDDEENSDEENNNDERRPFELMDKPGTNETLPESPGFFTQVISKVKSGLGSVSLEMPSFFGGKSTQKNATSAIKQEDKYSHQEPAKPYRKYKRYPSLYRRPGPPPLTARSELSKSSSSSSKAQSSSKSSSSSSKSTATETETTAKPSSTRSWSIFG